MAAKPKKGRRENPEAVPDVDETEREKKAKAARETPDDENDEPSFQVKKKVGRPKQQRVYVNLPKKTRDFLATAPLSTVQKIGTFAGVQIAYDKEAVDGLVEAFNTYCDSLDIELTPGKAYLVSLGIALGSMQTVTPPPATSANPLSNAERDELEKLRRDVEELRGFVRQWQQGQAAPATVDGRVLKIVGGDAPNARPASNDSDSAQAGPA